MRLIEWDDKPNMVHVNFYESLTPGRCYLAGEFFRTDRFGGLASFEDFVAGIEYSFKARRGEVVASLSFDPEPDLSDGKAKQYRVQLSHYQGVLRLIRTENAFYALMALGADEKDAVAVAKSGRGALGRVVLEQARQLTGLAFERGQQVGARVVRVTRGH